MNCCIFCTVNAGLYFWNGSGGILVDGIHDGPELGYSPMPESLHTQLVCHTGLFSHTNSVLFTHLHGDHFQPVGIENLLCHEEPPAVYGPCLKENTLHPRAIGNGLLQLETAGFRVFMRDTIHDGGQYEHDPHQSFLLCTDTECFFIAGDACLNRERAEDFTTCCSAPVEGAFFNLYQLASSKTLDFIRQLTPKRIFLYHLPEKKDDRYQYRMLARQVARRLPKPFQGVEIPAHMDWIDGQQAGWCSLTKGV